MEYRLRPVVFGKLWAQCPETNMQDTPSSPIRVLLVDDDADVRRAASLLLGRHGMVLHSAASPEDAWSVLAATAIDVVLLDLNFRAGAVSGEEGLRCLAGLIAHDPDAVVLVVTGHSGLTIAVAAMRAGAADFIMKPWSNDRLILALRDAGARRQRLRAARSGERPAVEAPMIGESLVMRQVLALAERAATSDAAVLLLGEAGAGKTLLAHAIHRNSPRAPRPLVTLDAAILWGESPAALATALAAIDGRDTLLLESVHDWPPAVQARISAFLDQPGEQPRLIATARQPKAALPLGADLLDRLSTIEIMLPPLRDRDGDAVRLAEHFLRAFARRHARPAPALDEAASAAIAAAPWPGNVRELRQAMERAVVLGDGSPLQAEAAVPALAGESTALPGEADLNLARSERAVVQAALRRHGFNVSRAARELGLTRAALYRRMARHGF
jgi:DNA-binding NtrC family response regulator